MNIENIEIAVVGVTRNGSRRMLRQLEVLRKATRHFRRVHFLVVESDSDDHTVDLLRDYSARDPALRFISKGHLKDTLRKRTERIAYCRNVYLDEIRANPLYSSVAYVIVADLDGVCKDVTPEGLASCWSDGDDWGACTANQGDYYYDLWALRHPVWCPGDVWKEHAQLLPLFGEPEATNVALFSRMIHLPPHRKKVEVHSAFGGLGIYRKEALLSSRYVGLLESGEEICEHVTLHAGMREQGWKIFINPAMISARRTKHAGRKGFWRTQRRRLWSWLRGQR